MNSRLFQKQLTFSQAVTIGQLLGARNKEEENWIYKDYLEYLSKNGRRYFYLVCLDEKEILDLIPNECQDDDKAKDLLDKFKMSGYNSISILCLRDINPGESGSYYVENGKHRVKALKEFLSLVHNKPQVYALIACRNKL